MRHSPKIEINNTALTQGSSTIQDVAALAGVSAMTVSRVLNKSSRVAESTRTKIEAAIEHLGYVPNTLARGLKGSTHTLGLIIPDVSNPFFTNIVHGAEEVAWQQGYAIFLGNTHSSSEREKHYLYKFLGHSIDGLLIAPSGHTSKALLEIVQARNIPFVLVDAKVKGIEADTVVSDNVQGAFQLTERLIQLGHKRIAYIGGRSDISTARERERGYKKALEYYGLQVNAQYVFNTDFSRDAGYQTALALAHLAAPPTAIFAANNFLAVGAAEALRTLKLRIPQDIALVCFEDVELASALQPFLTVMEQPALEFGRIGTTFLLERIANPKLPVRSRVLMPSLIVRKSCGAPLQKKVEKQKTGETKTGETKI
ncbi:MAG: LacI family DNA-binding transcriptional regulator [Trueperaceae bacterium]